MFKNFFKVFTVLIISTFITASAGAASTDGNFDLNIERESQYKLLRDIGIYNNEEIEKLGTNAELTRSDFLKYIIRALKINTAYTGEQVFSDVTPDMPYYNDVMTAYSIGLIYGYNGSYRATDKITHMEAITIAMRALGYGDYCSYIGYPNGYVTMASEIDIINSRFSAGEDTVTYEEMTEFLINVMSAPMLEMTGTEGDNILYDNDRGENLFGKYYDIYEKEGVVTANSYTALSYVDSYDENFLRIDNEIIGISDEYQNNYLGYNVRVFYRFSEKEGTSIVYIARDENEEIFVDATDIESADLQKIRYYDDNREKTASVDVNTSYIYNGKALDMNSEYNAGIFDMTSGNLMLVNNDKDSYIDVVIITKYVNIVFKAYNEEDEIVFDYLGNNLNLYEKDYILVDENNKVIKFSNLKEYDIISAAVSMDEEYYILKASFERITGNVERMIDSDKVYINGNEYYLTDEAFSEETVSIYIGMKGTFFLTADGKVAYVKEIESEAGKVGVLLSLNISEDDEETVFTSILTSKSEIMKTHFAEKIKLDGKGVKGFEAANTLLSGNKVLNPLLICYELNEDGLVSMIDTQTVGNTETETTLHKICDKTDSLLYKSGDGNFGKKFYPASDVVFFGFPVVPTTDTTKYVVTRPWNDYKKEIELYSFNENPVLYNVGILYGDYTNKSARINTDAYLTVVHDVKYVLTEEKELMYKVSLYERANLIEKYLDEEAADEYLDMLNPGNIIRYGLNVEGNIGIVDLIYDSKSGTFPADKDANGIYDKNDNNNSNVIGSDVTFSIGYVKEKHGNYISVISENNINSAEIPYAYPLKSEYIYVLHTDDYTVEEVKTDMIKDYKSFGGQAHKVVAGAKYDQAQSDFYFIFIEEE